MSAQCSAKMFGTLEMRSLKSVATFQQETSMAALTLDSEPTWSFESRNKMSTVAYFLAH